MDEQDVKVYRNDQGQVFIDRDDHRRYCVALLGMARLWGGTAEKELRKALQNGVPGKNGAAETLAYFGRDVALVQKMLEPLMEMIVKTLPGFHVWMIATGFGDDKDFILALLNWQKIIDRAPKPTGVDRRTIFQRISANLAAMHVPWMRPYVVPDPHAPEIFGQTTEHRT